MHRSIRSLPLGEPGKFLPEFLSRTTDSEAFPDLSPVLETLPPPRGLADVWTEVLGLADVRVIDGDEHDTLPSLGVHHKLPQILGHWNIVLGQPDLFIVYLQVS